MNENLRPQPLEVTSQGEIILETNPKLFEIKSQLETTQVNWNKIFQDENFLKRYESDVQGSIGALLEAHLRTAFDSIELESGITYPFSDGEISSSNFLFRPTHKGMGVEILKKEPTESTHLFESYTEIDLFASVGSLPVILEAKLRRSMNNGHGRSMSYFFTRDYMDRKLKPLSELFGISSFGFAIVTTRDKVTNSAAQKEFEGKRGMVIGIPVKYGDFIENLNSFKNGAGAV